MRQKIRMRGKAYALEQRSAESCGYGARHGIDLPLRFNDVVQRTQMTEEIEMLEHHAHARFGAGTCAVMQGPHGAAATRYFAITHILRIDLDRSPVERFEMVDEPKQRAFAGTARPQDHDYFAMRYRQVDAAQNLALAIRFPDVPASDKRFIAMSRRATFGRQQRTDPCAIVRLRLCDGDRYNNRRVHRFHITGRCAQSEPRERDLPVALVIEEAFKPHLNQ